MKDLPISRCAACLPACRLWWATPSPGGFAPATAPISRHWYYDHMDFWEYLTTIPAPRVIVLQDVDAKPGLRRAVRRNPRANRPRLGCIGYVTNGAVRDLPGIGRTGFHLFARGVSVSHAYAHVVDFGEPVEAGGLRVNPGDLLHGDLHGVVSVPSAIAGQIPAGGSGTACAGGRTDSVMPAGTFLYGKTAQADRADQTCGQVSP